MKNLSINTTKYLLNVLFFVCFSHRQVMSNSLQKRKLMLQYLIYGHHHHQHHQQQLQQILILLHLYLPVHTLFNIMFVKDIRCIQYLLHLNHHTVGIIMFQMPNVVMCAYIIIHVIDGCRVVIIIIVSMLSIALGLLGHPVRRNVFSEENVIAKRNGNVVILNTQRNANVGSKQTIEKGFKG